MTNSVSQPTLATLAEQFGHDVVANDGEKIGPLECILYESTSLRPVWVVASKGPLGTNLGLAPASSASFDEGILRVAHSNAELADEPHVDVGRGLDDLGEHELLCRYFGIPFDPNLDVRALRAGDDIPGLESVHELSSLDEHTITQNP